MNITATLTTESGNAEAASRALELDNVAEDNLVVSSKASGSLVETEIRCGSVGTLLNTLDDLLRCQILSEDLIKNG